MQALTDGRFSGKVFMMVITTVLSRISAILLLICIILISAYSVFAKEATTSSVAGEKLQQRKATVAQRVENVKEKISSREAALKVRLEKFKDKKKADTADRVNANLNNINQMQTGQMLKHLDKMTAILNRLDSGVSSKQGKTAIASASTAIASAEASVKTQAGKDYTIQVSSESTVKKDAQKVRDQLHTDLQAVRKLVIDAKQAVANAIRVAKSTRSTDGK